MLQVPCLEIPRAIHPLQLTTTDTQQLNYVLQQCTRTALQHGT